MALLAFIGNVLSNGSAQTPAGFPSVEMSVLTRAMLVFVVGVYFAALAEGGRYVTQTQYSRGEKDRGDFLNGATFLFGVASLAAFLVGGVVAYVAVN